MPPGDQRHPAYIASPEKAGASLIDGGAAGSTFPVVGAGPELWWLKTAHPFCLPWPR